MAKRKSGAKSPVLDTPASNTRANGNKKIKADNSNQPAPSTSGTTSTSTRQRQQPSKKATKPSAVPVIKPKRDAAATTDKKTTGKSAPVNGKSGPNHPNRTKSKYFSADDDDVAAMLMRHEFAHPSTSRTASTPDDEMMHSSDNESDDFVEVDDIDTIDDDLADYHPQLPEGGIDISLASNQIVKRGKKTVDRKAQAIQRMNKAKRELQVWLHKSSFVVLLTRAFYLNSVTKVVELRCLALSHLAEFGSNSDLKVAQINIGFVNNLLSWYHRRFSYCQQFDSELTEQQRLRQCLITRKAKTATEYLLAFVAILRSFSHANMQVRLCYPIDPIPLKVESLLLTDKQLAQRTSTQTKKPQKRASKSKAKSKHPILAERNKQRNRKVLSSESSDDEIQVLAARRIAVKEDHSVSNKVFVEAWLELYLESESRWICVEPVNGVIDKAADIEQIVKHPLTYVTAIDDKNLVKDVTKRYASKCLDAAFRRRRLQDGWIKETLSYFRPLRKSQQEVEEDRQLEVAMSLKPFPTTTEGFKNHPLYCLKKHLLKFQVIYPSDAPVLGFFKGDPIYPRDCVKLTHTRETWLKEARIVKQGESPYVLRLSSKCYVANLSLLYTRRYKIVTARAKRDKYTGEMLRDQPLEVFGFWQTEPFVPPIASDGKVPRNRCVIEREMRHTDNDRHLQLRQRRAVQAVHASYRLCSPPSSRPAAHRQEVGHRLCAGRGRVRRTLRRCARRDRRLCSLRRV